MAPNILKSSIENASFNIIFSVMCRVVVFFLNAFIIRHVGHAILGIINVRLLLLESIILFLSKEPFKKACLTNTAEHNWAQVINLLWMTIPICTVISFIFGYIWLYVLEVGEELPEYYSFAVHAIAISCVIELMSLTLELVASAFLFVRLKIILDTIMIALRTTVFVLLVLYNPENALFAFGVAQLTAAIFFTTSHYVYFYYYMKRIKAYKLERRLTEISDEMVDESEESDFPFYSIKHFLPGQLEHGNSYLNKSLTILTWSFFKQGIVKQVLTEGEKIIMTVLPILTFSQQGIYEVVNSLGSIAARFIFRPIEESSYFYFTQTIQRDQPLSLQSQTKIQESATVLQHLTSALCSFGLIVLVFGQSYSSLLLWLYGGENFSDSLPVTLLRAHCLAVLLMGINGVTEGYTNATADSDTINKNNLIMIYQSVAFLGASYVLAAWLGPIGFIYGNCINMILRIIHSSNFINCRYKETSYNPLQGLVPKAVFSSSLVLAAIITTYSQAYYFPNDKFLHLFIGFIMFIIVVISWSYENSALLRLGVSKVMEWKNRDTKDE